MPTLLIMKLSSDYFRIEHFDEQTQETSVTGLLCSEKFTLQSEPLTVGRVRPCTDPFVHAVIV